MKSFKFILGAVLLGTALSTTGFAATLMNSIPGQRTTDLGGGSYREELGTLFADRSVGFIPDSVSTRKYIDTAAIYGTQAELSAVNGQVVTMLSMWMNILAYNGDLSNFTRSTTTYSLAGVPYVVITNGGTPVVPPVVVVPVVTTKASKLVNMSVRAVVPVNGNIVPGFVIDGETDIPVLVRVVGPTLGVFGVGGTLSDPKFTVYDSKQAVAGSNDNWSDDPANKKAVTDAGSKSGAFGLVAESKDAAVIMTLKPGAYTAVISGAAGTTGEVLLEVYAVPQ